MSKEKPKYNCREGRHPWDRMYIPSKGKDYLVCKWCMKHRPVESEDNGEN